jgi:hypothetical protein
MFGIHGSIIGFGIGDDEVELPAKSVTVAVTGNNIEPGAVSVHKIIPVIVAGVGTHNVPGIVKAAANSTPLHVITIMAVVDAVQVGATGAVVSLVYNADEIVALPAASVVVITGFVTKVPGAVSVHTTFAVVSANDGTQVDPGIVSLAPNSTPLQVINTVLVPFPIVGSDVQVGAKGGVVSVTTGTTTGIGIGADAAVLPAISLIVAVAGKTIEPKEVCVHVTIAVSLAGVGIQVVPGIVNVAANSTELHVITIVVVPVAVQIGIAGATVSTVKIQSMAVGD